MGILNDYATVGDFVVSKDWQVYVIIDKVPFGAGITYDVAGVTMPYVRQRALTHSDLRHLGKLVRKEEAKELFKILYDITT